MGVDQVIHNTSIASTQGCYTGMATLTDHTDYYCFHLHIKKKREK